MALGSGPGCAGAARLVTAGAESPAASGQRSSFFEFTLRLAVFKLLAECRSSLRTSLLPAYGGAFVRAAKALFLTSDLLLKHLGLLLA